MSQNTTIDQIRYRGAAMLLVRHINNGLTLDSALRLLAGVIGAQGSATYRAVSKLEAEDLHKVGERLGIVIPPTIARDTIEGLKFFRATTPCCENPSCGILSIAPVEGGRWIQLAAGKSCPNRACRDLVRASTVQTHHMLWSSGASVSVDSDPEREGSEEVPRTDQDITAYLAECGIDEVAPFLQQVIANELKAIDRAAAEGPLWRILNTLSCCPDFAAFAGSKTRLELVSLLGDPTIKAKIGPNNAKSLGVKAAEKVWVKGVVAVPVVERRTSGGYVRRSVFNFINDTLVGDDPKYFAGDWVQEARDRMSDGMTRHKYIDLLLEHGDRSDGWQWMVSQIFNDYPDRSKRFAHLLVRE